MNAVDQSLFTAKNGLMNARKANKIRTLGKGNVVEQTLRASIRRSAHPLEVIKILQNRRVVCSKDNIGIPIKPSHVRGFRNCA